MNNLIKIGICGWGNVATGLYKQLSTNNNLDLNFEITCIGARRDNPKCDPSPIKIHRDIFDVIDDDIDVLIDGHVGYYCAGMNQQSSVTINGNAGVGIAENMMSGKK